MINLKINTDKNEYNIKCNEGKTLKTIITEEKIRFLFPCSGSGRCGNCKVKILKGDKPVTRLDKLKLDKELIEDGYRLACNTHVNNDMEIYLKEVGSVSI